MQVRDVMTRELLVTDLDEKVTNCKSVMFQGNIRHLAVVKEDRYCGLISLRDLLIMEMGEQRDTIKYLTDYMYFVPKNGS